MKGRVVLEEKQLLERLVAHGNHNIDWSYHILFGSKSDQRDLRPMVYSGKMIFPSPLDLTKLLGSLPNHFFIKNFSSPKM